MKILSILVLFLIINLASGFDVPSLTGPVVDKANMIDAKTEQALNSFIRGIHQKHKIQLQVLTVNSLDGESIEGASIQVTDEWKLGSENQDNGVLLIISKSDRQMRIEVGQGLEGNIPDAISKRIIEDKIKPFFKQGDFSRGIVAGVFEIAQYSLPDVDLLKNNQRYSNLKRRRNRSLGGFKLIRIIFIIIFIFFFRGGFFSFLFLGGLGRGGFSSGGGGFGGGGGGWSGGGGGFSGGGASGSW